MGERERREGVKEREERGIESKEGDWENKRVEYIRLGRENKLGDQREQRHIKRERGDGWERTREGERGG